MLPARRRALAIALGIVTVCAAGYGVVRWREAAARRAQEEAARALFEPATNRLAEAESAIRKVDLDTTIRVMREVDRALESSASFKEFLGRVSAERYDRVAPDVLKARAEILKVLQRLYAAQTAQKDQDEAWSFSRELLLGGLSVVHAGASSTSGLTFGVDAVHARRLLDDMKARRQERSALVKEIAALEGELLARVLDASTVWAKHLEEWDRLCALRERAAIAARAHDWGAVVTATDAAIELAPHEREAHLLKALALVETPMIQGEIETAHPARDFLEKYLEAHPEARAPALVVKGVLAAREGRRQEARLAFEEAAAAYPREAATLGEHHDSLKFRSEHLRKTREGRWVVDLNNATMLGAGAFSPDLQLARMLFDAGDEAAARAKVLDHFSRRRAQGQWELIVHDLAFASELLGPQLDEMFPEESYLDLVVRQTTFGGKLEVSVRNRSDRALHNATLVLLVRFTDMHRDDDEPFAPPTQPAILPHDTTEFGALEIGMDLFGKKKGVADIVSHRAIVVADEAVAWVDTEPFKLAQIEEAQARATREEKLPPRDEHWLRMTGVDAGRVAALVLEGAKLVAETNFGKDDLAIELPAALAILKPAFRLRYDGKDVATSVNELRDGRIRLKFEGIDDFEGDAPRHEIELRMASRLVAVRAVWKPDGKGAWKLDAVEPVRE